MKSHNLTKETTGTKAYTPPVCEVIDLEAQKIICASQTESVGENDGVW